MKPSTPKSACPLLKTPTRLIPAAQTGEWRRAAGAHARTAEPQTHQRVLQEQISTKRCQQPPTKAQRNSRGCNLCVWWEKKKERFRDKILLPASLASSAAFWVGELLLDVSISRSPTSLPGGKAACRVPNPWGGMRQVKTNPPNIPKCPQLLSK